MAHISYQQFDMAVELSVVKLTDHTSCCVRLMNDSQFTTNLAIVLLGSCNKIVCCDFED